MVPYLVPLEQRARVGGRGEEGEAKSPPLSLETFSKQVSKLNSTQLQKEPIEFWLQAGRRQLLADKRELRRVRKTSRHSESRQNIQLSLTQRISCPIYTFFRTPAKPALLGICFLERSAVAKGLSSTSSSTGLAGCSAGQCQEVRINFGKSSCKISATPWARFL